MRIRGFYQVIGLQILALFLFFLLIVTVFELKSLKNDIGHFWSFARLIGPYFLAGICIPITLSSFLFYCTLYDQSVFRKVMIFFLKNWLVTFFYLLFFYLIYTWIHPDFVYFLEHPAASDMLTPPPMISPWKSIHLIIHYIVIKGVKLASGLSFIISLLFALVQLMVFSIKKLII